MSMSTHIVGFKPAGEEHQKKLEAYRACERAGVAIPEELYDYFDGAEPSEHGVEVDLEARIDAISEWSTDAQSGFEVDIKKLPKDVTVIRFYNSW